jgi:hypothetical protein
MSTGLATLEKCAEGVKDIQDVIKRNKTDLDYYNDVEIPNYNVIYNNWKQRKREAEETYRRWENNWGEFDHYNGTKANLSNDIRHWRDCTGPFNRVHDETHDDWCANDVGPGWVHYRGDGNAHKACAWFGGATQWHGACKRSSDQVDKELTVHKNRSKPPTFTEQPPREPIKPATEPLGTIQCCSNIATIVGSEITKSVIDQYNACATKLENDISNAKALPKSSELTASPNQTPTQTSTQTSSQTSTQTLIIIIIVIFIILLISSSLITIVI